MKRKTRRGSNDEKLCQLTLACSGKGKPTSRWTRGGKTAAYLWGGDMRQRNQKACIPRASFDAKDCYNEVYRRKPRRLLTEGRSIAEKERNNKKRL